VVQVGGMTYKKTIMKNLLKKIKSCFSKKEVTLDPNSIENVILTTVNTIIQSPEIQGMTFKVSSSCDKTSVLNDIEFCNEVYVHDKYTWSVVDDACITACDVAYDLCHGGCSTIDWTCNNCCTKECKKGRDGCKSLCGYLDMTGGYEFRLTSIKGVGGIQVTNVYDVVANPNTTNLFSVSLDLNVPKVTAQAYYKIWQDPIPAMTGTIPVIASNVKGKAKGTLTIKCDENNPEKSGYYLHIDSIEIDIPKNVFDSNILLTAVSIFGMDLSYLTGGIVDLNQMLLDLADGKLANVVEGVLNDILDDNKLMDFDCTSQQN
jgi:hypothetical protein